MLDKLTIIENQRIALKTLDAMDGLIFTRLGTIIFAICEAFDVHHSKIYDYEMKEHFILEDDVLPIKITRRKLPVILDGKLWDLSKSIPTRWLFENFEPELSEGIRKYKQRNQNKVKNILKTIKLTDEQKEWHKKHKKVKWYGVAERLLNESQ